MLAEIIFILSTLALSQASLSNDHPHQRIVFCNIIDKDILQNHPVIGNNCTHIALKTSCKKHTKNETSILEKLSKFKEFKQRNGNNVLTYLSCSPSVEHGRFENDSLVARFAQNLFELFEEYDLNGFQFQVYGYFTQKQFNFARKLAGHFVNKTQHQFLLHLEGFKAANSTIVQTFENVTKFFVIGKRFINFMNENETLQHHTQSWVDAGIPKHKIIVSFTSYGIQWISPLGAPMPSTFNILYNRGAYKLIWNVNQYLENNGFRYLEWDNLHKCHYANFGNGSYVSFETTTSVAVKLNWIGTLGFAGAALTYVDYDNTDLGLNSFLLLRQIYNQIKESSVVTIPNEGRHYFSDSVPYIKTL